MKIISCTKYYSVSFIVFMTAQFNNAAGTLHKLIGSGIGNCYVLAGMIVVVQSAQHHHPLHRRR